MKPKLLIPAAFSIFLLGFGLAHATSSSFSDVSSSDWYYEEVMNLVDRGVVEGYSDNTYKPANEVNRAEMAVLMDRMLMLIQDACVFNDNIYLEGDTEPDTGCSCYDGEMQYCLGENS